jgi:pimeloyl-ACP methyl ester carboxylesterase
LKAAEQQAGMFLMHQVNEGSRRYLHEYDAALDPSQAIAKVPCPVLIVQGGQDESVFAENGERLFEARNAIDPVHTAKAFFPDLQHFYKKVQPGMPAMEAFALEDESDDRVSRAISEWLSSLTHLLTSTPVAKLMNINRMNQLQANRGQRACKPGRLFSGDFLLRSW